MTRIAAAGLTALALLVGAPLARAEDAAPAVKVESGMVAGRTIDGVDVYKGIPFAAAPVGSLRWAPPQPATAWSGARPAIDYGPACPQRIDPTGKPNDGGYIGPTSEDCLSVNVFAPHGAHGAPVMVWIYGGGNIAGANSVPSNDGTNFARDGVVLVSINYRLGALGYFAHPALDKAAGSGAPIANYGVMDQIAALEWIQHNINAFGGDPHNVTIFGESAGGMNVLTLLASPAARGLFQKASVESGGGWETPIPLKDAEAAGVALAQAAGLPADASAEQLRALPLDKLVGVEGRFGPILDGKLVRESYPQAFANGDAAAVPLIIGTNDFEASLLHSDPAGYLAKTPASVKAAYAVDAADDSVLAQHVFTDVFMGAPARWIATQASARAPTWLYEFTYVRVNRRGKLPGANHTSEIPYVFDSQMAVPVYKLEIQDEDRALAGRVHSCWVAFAKTGAPDCAGGPAWPAYTRQGDQLMQFDRTFAVREHWRKLQLDAVDQSDAPKF